MPHCGRRRSAGYRGNQIGRHSPIKPGEQDQPPAANEGGGTQQNRKGCPLDPYIQSVVEEYRADQKANSRRDSRRYRLEKLAFVVVLGYAIVTFLLWWDTRYNVKITAHSFEVAYGANIVPNYPGEFVLQRGKDSVFLFPYDNIGNSQASMVEIAFDNDLKGKDDTWTFHLDCFGRFPSNYFYKGAESRHIEQTIIPGGRLTAENFEKLLNGDLVLRAYGLIIYYNQFCYRCTTACFTFVPRPGSNANAEVLRGDASPCRIRPNCSRFGPYDDTLTCLQTDAADIYGYYPESDDNGFKFRTGRCGIPEAGDRERPVSSAGAGR